MNNCILASTLFRTDNNDNQLASATSYTDTNVHLQILKPFVHIYDDSEDSAFIVFMEDKRSELLKIPALGQHRNFEINMILRELWMKTDREGRQIYYDTVRRYLEIRKNLSGWKLKAKEVYGQGDAAFQKLNAETKKKYEDIALQNRKVFIKMYPDVQDFARWIPNNNNKTKAVAVASANSPSTETKKDDTSIMNDKITPLRPYQYCDSLDQLAADTYKETIRAMASEVFAYKVFWQAFLDLSDEEREIYYAEAIQKETVKRARALFAKDYGHPVRKPQQDYTFVKELTKVHCTWESLSAPAQQYYIDIAKENLLECQKHKVSDVFGPGESYYEFENEYGSMWGALMPKCVYSSGSTDEEKAVMLYLNHHQEELLKEPGMANKRQFQLAGIMHQRFMNLSDEERQPYFDIVQRVKEIRNHIHQFCVEGYRIFSKNFGTSRKWKDASASEKAVCEELKKRNMSTLLQKFPDVGAYFHWVVCNNAGDKSRLNNTITFVQKEGTIQNKPTEMAVASNIEIASSEKPSLTNKIMEQAATEVEGTSEVVFTVQKEEETTSVNGTDSTTAIVSDTVSQKDDSLESHSVDATVTADTSEMSKSEDTRETVKDENVNQEELISKTVFVLTKDESVLVVAITTENGKTIKMESVVAANDVITVKQISEE